MTAPTPCPIAAAVQADIARRAAVGLAKYGVTLGRTDLSRRDWLVHSYEEALDMACYLKKLIGMEDAASAAEDQPAEAIVRIKHYLAMLDAQPFRQSADVIHGIHCGTRWEADLLLSDLRAVMKEFPDAG